MPRTVTYTHKGWMGICPVYLADPYGPGPGVDARHAWLEPLHDLSIFIFGTLFWVATFVNPAYEPMWPMIVTGELPEPINKTFED